MGARSCWIIAEVFATMRFERRLRALERRLITEPTVLHFADGSTRRLHGRPEFLLRLVVGSCGGGELTPFERTQRDWVLKSVDADEPGGGRMCELIRAIAHSPTSDQYDQSE